MLSIDTRPSAGERATAPLYLTIAEACELANISRSTFYRLLGYPESGLAGTIIRIPGIQRIRVHKSKFIKWLESGASA